jgi:hypothetical protein
MSYFFVFSRRFLMDWPSSVLVTIDILGYQSKRCEWIRLGDLAEMQGLGELIDCEEATRHAKN